MIKNLYCCFCTNTQHSFILDYSGVEGEVRESCMENGCLNKWNQGKLLK